LQSGRCPYSGSEAGVPTKPLGAAMQQIADWLQKLALGQYAQRFAANDINFFAILPDLTDQDLKESGLTRSPSSVTARDTLVHPFSAQGSDDRNVSRMPNKDRASFP
jgi:SAM domain (Sterile alpha motif)